MLYFLEISDGLLILFLYRSRYFGSTVKTGKDAFAYRFNNSRLFAAQLLNHRNTLVANMID